MRENEQELSEKALSTSDDISKHIISDFPIVVQNQILQSIKESILKHRMSLIAEHDDKLQELKEANEQLKVI